MYMQTFTSKRNFKALSELLSYIYTHSSIAASLLPFQVALKLEKTFSFIFETLGCQNQLKSPVVFKRVSL